MSHVAAMRNERTRAKVAKHGLQTINALDADHSHEGFTALANAKSMPAVSSTDGGSHPGCARTVADLPVNWNPPAKPTPANARRLIRSPRRRRHQPRRKLMTDRFVATRAPVAPGRCRDFRPEHTPTAGYP